MRLPLLLQSLLLMSPPLMRLLCLLLELQTGVANTGPNMFRASPPLPRPAHHPIQPLCLEPGELERTTESPSEMFLGEARMLPQASAPPCKVRKLYVAPYFAVPMSYPMFLASARGFGSGQHGAEHFPRLPATSSLSVFNRFPPD